MRLHQIAAALFVTLLSLPALALSLGAPQGGAWIGQPLDLRVPLVLGGEDATGSLCTQVELRQGDAAHAEGGVQAVLEPGVAPERPNLRVRTRRPISEPVLNLRVKVGCQGVSSREFVLLADPPPVLAAVPMPRTESAAVDAAPAVRPAAQTQAQARAPLARAPAGGRFATEPTARSEPVPSASAAARTGERSRRAAPPARSTAAQRPATVARKSPAGLPAPRPVQGRLQLDALEPQAQPLRVARWGEASASKPVLATPDPRSQAVAVGAQASAVPASLRSEPAAAPAVPTAEASATLSEVERTTKLEAALAELRAQARQSEVTQAELRGELSDARDSRYSNPLVYALGLLLLMAAIALWMLWRASRRAPESPWTEAAAPSSLRHRLRKRHRPSPPAEADAEDTGQMPLYFPGAVSRRGQLTDDEGDEASLDTVHGALESRGLSAGLAPRQEARPNSARALDVDELFDVQQQAEFFSSLGQHEQAVEVLRHYVGEHPKASALAYLELLHLYHQLRREDDYEALREQCQQALNVRVPPFHGFGAVGGRTLEQYPQVRARLQSHWPHPQTLEVIEELLFRSDAQGEAFDLAAYRELLMLYGLVQEQRPGQAWPSLDELLNLPRMAQMNAAPVVSRWEEPSGGNSAPAADRFEAVLDPLRGDFEPTWPPALELDMDLARLESQQIDTIPMALRPTQAPDAMVPPGVPDLPDLTLAPRTEPGGLQGTQKATGAGAYADAKRSKQAPVSAFLP